MAAHRNPARSEAVLLGITTYFTGKPCKNGHLALRNTSDSSCVACRLVFKEGYRKQAAAYTKAKRDARMAIDPEGTRAAWALWQRERRKEIPEIFRERGRRNNKVRRQRNPKAKLACTRKRQAAKQQRTPAWAEVRAMTAFYVACPEGMVVDHVIPLRGKLVSGLHVLENLQYLTKLDNLKKGNSYAID